MLTLLVLASFDVDTMHAARGRDAFLTVESAAPSQGWEAGAALGIERGPLVLVNPALGGAIESRPVDVRTTMEVGGALTRGRWTAAASMPLVLANGDAAASGQGDLRLEGRAA